MSGALARFVESPGFTRAVYALIAINAVALGLEALPGWHEALETELQWLFDVSTVLFSVEILLRIAAFGRRPQDFLRDGWNVFDLAVVVACLLPIAGGAAVVVRLLRLARLLRLVSGTGVLRGFVRGDLPTAVHLGAGLTLLALIVYAFALSAFHLAGGVLGDDPAWADLPHALRSLLAWATRQAPPAAPADGTAGLFWQVALFGTLFGWLLLLLRGLWPRRSRP